VVLKLHGATDRHDPADSYVLTEDSYIDYLGPRSASSFRPR
jgi:hypothetical protein